VASILSRRVGLPRLMWVWTTSLLRTLWATGSVAAARGGDGSGLGAPAGWCYLPAGAFQLGDIWAGAAVASSALVFAWPLRLFVGHA